MEHNGDSSHSDLVAKPKYIHKAIGLATLIVSLWILYRIAGNSFTDFPKVFTLPILFTMFIGALPHMVANSMLARAWGIMLQALGAPLPAWRVAWIWTRAQLARYLVGSAGLVGRPVLAKAFGVPLRIGTSTTLLESVWLMAIMGLFIPSIGSYLPAEINWWMPLVLFIGAFTFVVAITLFPKQTLQPLQYVRANLQLDGLQASFGWKLSGIYALQLALRTTSFVALGLAIAPNLVSASPQDLAFAISGLTGAFIVSSLVGWLFIFSPGGIGPREAVAGVMIASIGMTGIEAMALVVLARLMEVLGELAYVVWVSVKQRNNV